MSEDDDILLFINKSIKTENGVPVTENSMFIDADMDSLGTLIALMNIGTQYDIEESELEDIDLSLLSVKDLINKCKS
jgi:acyl carrier protein